MVHHGKEPTLMETAEKELNANDDNVALADLDLTHCERLESSYWKRPQHYELKSCSGRTDLCKSVLNDDWISRPTGEEGNAFLSSRKNMYEEEMFKVCFKIYFCTHFFCNYCTFFFRCIDINFF